MEVKPFGNVRADLYEIEAGDEISLGVDTNKFDRTLGQVGVDIRYPFIKLGEDISWTVEPRLQLTESFGDAKLDEFDEGASTDLIFSEDAGNADLSAGLLWQSNKASGFDFWQEGTRLDVGGSVAANWGRQSSASLFVGQSFASGGNGELIEGLSGPNGDFLAASGLQGDKSDIIGEASLNLGRTFKTLTKLRYNEDTDELTRIESTASLNTKRLQAGARYFRLDSETNNLIENAPQESISGSVRLHVTDNWSTSYSLIRDLDRDITPSQTFGVRYRDECTLIELLYTNRNFGNDAIRDKSSIGFRVSLLSLGDFGR